MIPIPAQAPQSSKRYLFYDGFGDARRLRRQKYQTCQRKARSPTCPPLTRLGRRSRRSRRRQATTSSRSTRRSWSQGGLWGRAPGKGRARPPRYGRRSPSRNTSRGRRRGPCSGGRVPGGAPSEFGIRTTPCYSILSTCPVQDNMFFWRSTINSNVLSSV